MIAVENTILLLLAAGRSERFGDVGSKLDEDFLGKPLGLRVAVTLEDMPFKERIAIVRACGIDYSQHNFTMLRNDDPVGDMASSVRRGVACAKERGADAVLFALADMPRVTAAHIHRLFDAATDTTCVVSSSDGVTTKPPALFGSERFDHLLTIQGDQGARDMVRAGRHVVTAPAELIDVDTREELEELRALIHSPAAITRAVARRSD
ncbi:MAG TPA: nucleotidyltransferase family protein [Sphingomonas sp.]|jgi:molybdenum cofactor cytidylyltransferase|uniref:nucleotidyltransferase family protein n=1 Tax=Sphingomonas sp. TaxID=28214 RepID=UPI002ED8C69A